ncbi:MAG: site-2 protease family protein [Patescibacteria group bacterium]
MSVVLFLIVLAVLIISHEFGHFIAAKRSGVRVDEFAIGFPPKIYSWTRGETKYSINLLPFGGYVKIFGEDMNEEIPEGERGRSFSGKKRIVQAMIVLSGVFFNFVLAWFLLSAGFLMGMPMPLGAVPKGAVFTEMGLTVAGVMKNSPAERAGLSVGDKVTALGTIYEKPKELTPEKVREFIAAHSGEKIAIVYGERKGESKNAIVIPENGIVDGKSAIGVYFEMMGTVRLPIHLAIWEGAKETFKITEATAVEISKLIKNAFIGEADISALAGPIGIVSLVGAASHFGFAYLISFVALISVNLGILNLIPFPALDGGRALFIAIESVIRRPIPRGVSNTLNFIGFALLIALMLVVTYQDIARILVK